MADTSKVEIKIQTTADTAGATQTAAALDKVGTSAAKAGDASRNAGKNVGELGENFEKGAAAGRVFAEISRGNVLALGQLGAAIKALGALLRANLIGGLITLGAIAGTVLLPIIKGFLDTKKTAEDATKGIDSTRKSVEDLGKQRLENLVGALDLIKTSAGDAQASLKSALEDSLALADAQDRLDLARISADPNLSNEQKAQGRLAVGERAANRRSGAAVSLAQDTVGVQTRARDSFSSLESEAAARLSRTRDALDNITSARAEANAEISRTNADFAARSAEITASTPDGPIRQSMLRQEVERTQAAQAEPVARRNLLDSPEGLAREAGLKAQIAAETEALNRANAAALASASELVKAEQELTRIRTQQAALLAVDAETRKLESAPALAEARARDAAGRVANQSDLVQADASNIGARTAVKVGELTARNTGIDPAVIADATAKARALATGGSTAEEGNALAAALGPLLLAVQALPGNIAKGEATKYQELLKMVRETTQKLATVEAQLKNGRTQ